MVLIRLTWTIGNKLCALQVHYNYHQGNMAKGDKLHNNSVGGEMKAHAISL